MLVAAAGLVGVVAWPAAADATPGTFSGSCQFSGPIVPSPPITVVPKSGSRFSYAGTGTCTGTLDGTAVTAAPDTVTFTNDSTLFDTCEFGPDVGLAGQLVIGAAADRAQFAVTINLARLALAGPFELATTGGGAGIGTATFTPPSSTGAVTQCAATGIGTATLGGNFTTTAQLVGAADPATAAATTSTTTPTTTPPVKAKRCLAGPLVVKLHPSRGQRVISAVISVDGHRVERVRGHRLTAFRLPGLRAGAHTVRLVTRTSRGRVQHILRHYTLCA
jgi:hypothetical protein